MRRVLSFVSALALLALTVVSALAPATAQPGDLGAMFKRFTEAYTAGDYAAALVEAQKLEAAVKTQFGINHTDYAAALSSLAGVYWAQGKYAEAEAHLKRALAIFEAKLGTDDPAVAETLKNLALVYWAQGKVAEAEAHYKRALAIFEAKLGKDHPSVADMRHLLSFGVVVFVNRGRRA